MKDLKLGDKVLVGEGVYEPIYSFGHRLEDTVSLEYLEIATVSLKLELSREHMVFLDGSRAVPAAMIRIGDRVELASGESAEVQSVRSIYREGMFGPFTPSGRIIVNGVKCSIFIALKESETLWIRSMNTRLTYHFLAHTFEAPHRIWCKYFSTCQIEHYTEGGVSIWLDVPRIVMMWVLQQHVALQALILLPFTACLSLTAYPLVIFSVAMAWWVGRRFQMLVLI
jgi:hypothetical protein